MSEIKQIAKNKKARYNYEILETYETGIELKGTEVKSIRSGKVNLTEGFVSIDNGEVFLKQVNISPYEQGNIFNVDPTRIRKLLLHKKEIAILTGEITQKGHTLVPLTMYLKNGKVKLSIGLGKGKKMYDKRETIAKRESDIRIKRELKNY